MRAFYKLLNKVANVCIYTTYASCGWTIDARQKGSTNTRLVNYETRLAGAHGQLVSECNLKTSAHAANNKYTK